MPARGAIFALWVAVAAILWALPSGAVEDLDVTVVVDNLRSDRGHVKIALWSKANGFTKAEAAIVETSQPAQPGQVRFRIPGLNPGRYAIASYHDENANDKFDQTWIGLPDEGLGFSNGAWIGLGPPSFDEAAIDIKAATRVIRVKLRY